MADDVTLMVRNGATTVSVAVVPDAGGRVRNITVTNGDASVDLFIDADGADGPLSWGSFPLAPWAGRIRHGRFRFLGDDVRLDLNHDDDDGSGGGPIDPPVPNPESIAPDDRRHAIHGTTYFRPWTVIGSTETTIEMTCAIEGPLNWPYRGVARQRLSLHADRLEMDLAVEVDERPAPVSLGWHPWFVKPDLLEFEPVAVYRRDGIGITTGELVTPHPSPWDDCFVNHRPVRLHYDRPVVPVVTVSSNDCDHWVVFDELDTATCVEPHSGPPDAPNLRPEVATPTHPIRRSMTISW